MIRADGIKLNAMIIFQEVKDAIPLSAYEKLKIPENVIVKANKSSYCLLNY